MALLFSIFSFFVLLVDAVLTDCSVGCKSCAGSTCSSCKSSYFLNNGFCSQCPENCNSCINYDECTTCKANKHSLHARCAFNCDKYCLNTECHDDTGFCKQCNDGLYGLQCQQNCSFCAEELCDLHVCSNGCRDGYFEYKSGIESLCQTCPSNCRHCRNGHTCYDCNYGYHLYKFNDNVHCILCTQGAQCLNFCFIHGCKKCQITNMSLVCTDCPEGQTFNGDSCVPIATTCLNECSTSCDSNGICLGKCMEGYTGERCSKICNSRCRTCSKENGNTCQQCKGAFYTTDCSLTCKPSCKVVDGKSTCRLLDGYCLNGCVQTFWGDHCNQSCSNGCVDLACYRTTGKCIEGCKDGYTGEKCVPTTTGYTEAISTSTSPTQLHPLNELGNKSNDFVIGLFSGIGISVVIVAIALLFCLLRRRYLKRKQPKNESHNANIRTNFNTRTVVVAVEQAYEASHYESLSDQRDADTVYSDIRPT